MLSPNAITISSNHPKFINHPVQLITTKIGSIENIFETFDFSCCKCAISSDKKFVTSENFSNEITINQNFQTTTIERYYKYMNKGATDVNGTIEHIIKHFVINYCEKYENFYRNSLILGANILNYACSTSQPSKIQLIHDVIIEILEPYEAIKLFQKLNNMLIFSDKIRTSPELIVCIINRKVEGAAINANNTIPKSKLKNAKKLYPEYFI